MVNMHPETEPLLASDPTSPTRKSKKFLILIVCATFLLSAEFGFFMSTAPQTAVFEDIICRNYQADLHRTQNGTLPDPNPCKSETVQGELAIIIGYKDTFDMLPSMSLGDQGLIYANLGHSRHFAIASIWDPFRSLGEATSAVSQYAGYHPQ
jgi:hypothetical protein